MTDDDRAVLQFEAGHPDADAREEELVRTPHGNAERPRTDVQGLSSGVSNGA